MPREESIHRYCMRLKEHGWHINRMVRKALQCGIQLDQQVAGERAGEAGLYMQA